VQRSHGSLERKGPRRSAGERVEGVRLPTSSASA
jgi:hypothetical protein